MNTLPENPLPSRGLTRRNVVRGAAWTVPAVTLVTAAPAFAASPSIVTGELTFRPQPGAWNELGQGNLPDLPEEIRPPEVILDGDIWFETNSDEPTPPLTMTLTFPESWLAAGVAAAGLERLNEGLTTAPVIALAHGQAQAEWLNGWEATANVGPHGLHTSPELTFTFRHPGGVSSDGSPTFFDFMFSAWVPGDADVSSLADAITVSVVADNPDWTIIGGPSGVIPILSRPPAPSASPDPSDD